MRVPYKNFPTDSDPGYAGATTTWMPIVTVSLMIGHTKSPRFDALVDSGASQRILDQTLGGHWD
jgi:hypothetical protein